MAGSTFGTLPGQSGSGDMDCFIRKYDFVGNEVWTRQFGTYGYDLSRGIAWMLSTWPDGRAALCPARPARAARTSSCASTTEMEPNCGPTSSALRPMTPPTASTRMPRASTCLALRWHPAGPGQCGGPGLVSKYNPAGNLLWTRQFGTAADDISWGITANSGAVYLVGSTFGTLPGQVTVARTPSW